MKKSGKYLIIAIPVLVLGVLVMSFAGSRLIETQQVYQEADNAYEEISGLIRKPSSPAISDSSPNTAGQLAAGQLAVPPSTPFASTQAFESEDAGASQEPQEIIETPPVYIPDFEIDFELLESINADAAAWLYGPDSVIDYPVMRADDYSYYLSHLPNGVANANGSLFIDYNNSPDFTDRLTVIYGHHMKSGSMFGGLKGYKEQSYYDERPYMYLYTRQGDYRIDLMYGFVVAAGQWQEQAFMYEENVEALLAYARQNTTFESGVEHREGDRIIALSTCSYEFNEARYVVIGILRQGVRS